MTADDTATHDPGSAAEALSAEPESAGSLEARYRMEGVIASGGMGVVVAATHKHLGTRVAIKLLHEASGTMRQRFLREAKLAATLTSPYVARVLDYGFNASGQPMLVMDYVEGRTLKRRMADGPERPAEALRLARELLLALSEVHHAGIVHRDIKPANVLLMKDAAGVEHVKLIDFGIAKRLGARDDDLTGSGEILGTVSYMAPEQIAGTASVDQRADLFSVGVVLYEMLSGRRAFESSARGFTVAMSQGRTDVPFAPLRDVVAGLDVRLERVVSRCLEIDPSSRFPDASAVIAALPEVLDATGTEGQGQGLAPTGTPVSAPSPRRAWPWVIGVGTLGLLGVGLGVLLTRPAADAAPAPPQATAPRAPSAMAPSASPTPAPSASSAPAPSEAPATAASTSAAPRPSPAPGWVRPVAPQKPTARDPRFDDRH